MVNPMANSTLSTLVGYANTGYATANNLMVFTQNNVPFIILFILAVLGAIWVLIKIFNPK